MSSPKRSSTKRRWLTAADLGIEQPAAPHTSCVASAKQEPAKAAQETSTEAAIRVEQQRNTARSINEQASKLQAELAPPPRDSFSDYDDLAAELERVKQQLEQERAAKMQWASDCRKAKQISDELLAALKRIDSELEGRLPVTALIKEIAQAAIAGRAS